ncbi:MAG TPA: cytochrome C [Geobacteraceae bacterium]|nr:cytochrome C [Geobacteraceae bacterium]
MKRLTLFVVCAGFAWSGSSIGADLPSLVRGQELFESEHLGTSGKSCATCHPGGKKLEGAGNYGDDELTTTVNTCIAGPLKGKILDPESTDMKSLVLYLKSFSKPGI